MESTGHDRSSKRGRHGLTLVELVVVLAILVALAGIAVPRLLSTADTAREQATRSSAIEIRNSLMQFWSDCKFEYPTDSAADQRIQLAHLLEQPLGFSGFNPNVGLGWNGPYMQTDGRKYLTDSSIGFTANYGNASQPAIRDAFANQDIDGDGNAESGLPFVIQEPTLRNLEAASLSYALGEPREVRVVSAGPNGVLEIDELHFASDLDIDPTLIGDDIYVTIILR